MAGAPTALQDALQDCFPVERELGRGGMGLVFLARDLRHQRQVVVKVIRPELASVVGAERFGREIQLAARLQHPNIVPVYESGECAGTLYYVMPYVAGESLRERLRREGPLALDEVVRIAREVADALGYAHARGVVHRDIKPENILLAGGHALVADFGIARALGGEGSERLTETGLVLGTPAYMSPEQSRGSGALDGRSDLYALGCVVYEMLAGEPPYTGPSAQAIIAKRLSEPVPHLRTVREEIPAAVEEAVTRALAKTTPDETSMGSGQCTARWRIRSRPGTTCTWPRSIPGAYQKAFDEAQSGIGTPDDDFLWFHKATTGQNLWWQLNASGFSGIAPGAAVIQILRRRIGAGVKDSSRLKFYFTPAADGGYFGYRPGGDRLLPNGGGSPGGNYSGFGLFIDGIHYPATSASRSSPMPRRNSSWRRQYGTSSAPDAR